MAAPAAARKASPDRKEAPPRSAPPAPAAPAEKPARRASKPAPAAEAPQTARPSAPAPAESAPAAAIAAPEHLVQPENALEPITLDDLPEWLRANCRAAGWEQLNPVQAYAMPYVLASRDIMVQARTGSGKTGAFLLPILQLIDPSKAKTQALVLLPTRELAVQVQREAEKLTPGGKVRAVAVYGGVGYGPQLEALRAGAHLVVGTPGRILDHLMRRSMDLSALRVLVFDEADRMLSMGFYPDMCQVKRYLPGRQSGFMFSATYPETVRSLARQFMRDPGFLSLSHDQVHVADTDHVYYDTPAMEKDRCLARILEVENPESAIIFCNTKVRVNYVTAILERYGYDADQMTADLAQKDRERVLEKLREKKLRFLVATDLAGRGIDIPKMSHVIQYEFPDDYESYIHRAGRTGRAGEPGVAIALVNELERSNLMRVAARYGIELERREVPNDEATGAFLRERIVAELEGRLRGYDALRRERLSRFVPLVRALAQNDDEVEVLAMLLFEMHERSLHERPATPASAGGSAHQRMKRPASPAPPSVPTAPSSSATPRPAPAPAAASAPAPKAAAKPAAPAPEPPAPALPPASGDLARRKVRSLKR